MRKTWRSRKVVHALRLSAARAVQVVTERFLDQPPNG